MKVGVTNNDECPTNEEVFDSCTKDKNAEEEELSIVILECHEEQQREFNMMKEWLIQLISYHSKQLLY